MKAIRYKTCYPLKTALCIHADGFLISAQEHAWTLNSSRKCCRANKNGRNRVKCICVYSIIQPGASMWVFVSVGVSVCVCVSVSVSASVSVSVCLCVHTRAKVRVGAYTQHKCIFSFRTYILRKGEKREPAGRRWRCYSLHPAWLNFQWPKAINHTP